MTNSLLTIKLIQTPSRCYVRKYHDENAIERRMLKAVEIDQVNSRFVLLLRWMKIIFAKRRKNACFCCYFDLNIWKHEENAQF
jgi:metal-sulfur cluster biosynthetic enzyme